MSRLQKIEVTPGVTWVEVPEADLRILCGCPADSVKHLMRRGLISPTFVDGVACETGPNTILLSDVPLQNGAFCSLGEFPVLQMLYRQGMILPDHPNNVGRKPLLIGRRTVVDSQMAYIYRGNYGLTSEEEIMEAGASPELARRLMRLKLRFAFGRIQDPRELLDSLIFDDTQPVEIRDGVTIQRTALNVFEISYGGQQVTVDLNLPAFEAYECPYPLGAFQFRREYFAVVHSGEGDGWDIKRPAMGSILVFQGRLYLVDAGPNLSYSLSALGIGINEIEGIFHTHSHDDHFAGLTTLIQADRRIKYFATPLVRHAVSKKLSALLGLEEREFSDYFDVVDLLPEEWNNIDGLEVRPLMSPHPVETTAFFFRALSAGGWRSYAHLADVASLSVLQGMVEDDPDKPGIDRAWYEQVRDAYLEPADLKKVDIGGGMIHGDAHDYIGDTSTRLILAHTALKLTEEQKRIGSGASFGTIDVLVPSHRDFIWRSAFAFLHNYFSLVPPNHIHALMNGPIRTFNPETILIREDSDHDAIFLLLTGQVEMTSRMESFQRNLSAGALMGEQSGLWQAPAAATYRAVSFVQALEIPVDLYIAFVRQHDLFLEIEKLMTGRRFLQKTWLCSEVMSNSTLNGIAKRMTEMTLAQGDELNGQFRQIGIIRSGRLVRRFGGADQEFIGPGAFFGEETAIFNVPASSTLTAVEPTEILVIPPELLKAIPNVRWKLFESVERQTRIRAAVAQSQPERFDWHEDYSVGIPQIDDHHRQLLGLAGTLVDELNGQARPDLIEQQVGKLLATAEEYFAVEEKLHLDHGFDDAEAHARRHRQLVTSGRAFGLQLLEGTLTASDVLAFFHKWFINHILIDDNASVFFCSASLNDAKHLCDVLQT